MTPDFEPLIICKKKQLEAALVAAEHTYHNERDLFLSIVTELHPGEKNIPYPKALASFACFVLTNTAKR